MTSPSNLGAVTRWLRWFDRDSEAMVGEYELVGVELSRLQPLFLLPEDDPMVECYPVGPAEAAGLSVLLEERSLDAGEEAPALDLEVYDWFLECDAGEWTGSLAPRNP